MAEQQYNEGGYIGPAGPTWMYLSPDECTISFEDVRAGRIVCSRPGHPTQTSDCHRGN